jgi:hypothetical protein
MRSTLARFRISAHKLEIERGRYTIPKTAVEDRICKRCNCEAVEDEEHLSIKCNKYSFARNTFFSNINNNFFSPELSESFILSKYFSCWNINLNLQYVRNLFSFLLVAGFCLTKLIFSLQIFAYLSFNFFLNCS